MSHTFHVSKVYTVEPGRLVSGALGVRFTRLVSPPPLQQQRRIIHTCPTWRDATIIRQQHVHLQSVCLMTAADCIAFLAFFLTPSFLRCIRPPRIRSATKRVGACPAVGPIVGLPTRSPLTDNAPPVSPLPIRPTTTHRGNLQRAPWHMFQSVMVYRAARNRHYLF